MARTDPARRAISAGQKWPPQMRRPDVGEEKAKADSEPPKADFKLDSLLNRSQKRV